MDADLLTPRMAKLECEMNATDNKPKRMVCQPIIGEGIFRFDCSEHTRDAAYPSFSFANVKDREADITTCRSPEYIPVYLHSNGQQIVTVELPVGTFFYGTGEVSGPLERTGKRVFTWNTDAFGYGSGTTSLYQSHPWVLALLPNGDAYGILADTTYRCEVDLCEASMIRFVAPAVYPVVTFGPFASPFQILASLYHAIGNVFMPPKWSLGYHQCRYSYGSDERVLKVAKTFREKGIPCDVMWMDIDYMDSFRCFTFDQERFADPKSLVDKLHTSGFKAIWILDPGIKCEEGYSVYDSGCENDVWVLQADGKPFVGEVWPGPCVFPDFTQAKVRHWWANLVKDFICNGADGIWNDMNEPAVSKVRTKTMPESNIHRGDKELGGWQSHSHYHNVYGMLMAKSTYEGMKLATRKKRPFVLTRAGYIGSQRYAATWTGDNLSTWEHLHMSIQMVLSLGLSGQPLAGPDIGGFGGNATARLFGRWMGIAAMFPFCRGHTDSGTIDHEPWAFGQECEEVCRLALLRRYQLLPYIYTLFYMSHTKGAPVVAPIFFADSKDKNLRKIENEFLLGSILVCASTLPDKGSNQIQFVLPKGSWLQFDFGDSHPDLPLLYLQGGSIVPVGRPIQYVGEESLSDDLILIIALDEHGKANGILYEDAGDGYDFCEGEFLLSYYEAELKSSVVTVRVSRSEGSWRRPRRALLVHLLLGFGAKVDAVGVDGEELDIVMPPASEISSLLAEAESRYRAMMESANPIPDSQPPELLLCKGTELSRIPVELESSDWVLHIVPWIGGRIISMLHAPSGMQWLQGEIEIGGYEEYSGVEYQSAGRSEKYSVVARNLEQPDEEETISLKGDIGGGLVLLRCISLPKEKPEVLRISSRIVAENLGPGSGGFSRVVCLRVHPTFTVQHPTEVYVAFTSMVGSKFEFRPESGDLTFEGDGRPNGEWMLVDRRAGFGLVNRFDKDDVQKCMIRWRTGICNLELFSAERPVSKDAPLQISHEYEVIPLQ
ncbi:uncharacterized protein LOC116252095 [Nymphaea colorata]|nr:uncharacterized protein LOC116252095 [Nymphaea colorata]XP_031482015.1 uncharacterized protein LOC116252095 [Nymphaea colorata]XP_049933227.1 uncharacterized protein LOC116252095 [Nymphaea colorata]